MFCGWSLFIPCPSVRNMLGESDCHSSAKLNTQASVNLVSQPVGPMTREMHVAMC